MPDPRFYRRAGPFPLHEIGTRVSAIVASPGRPDLFITDIAALAAAGGSELVYVADNAYLPALAASRCGACLVKSDVSGSAPAHSAVLIVDDPRAAFARIAALFYPDASLAPANPPTSEISPDTHIESSAVVSAGAVIGAGTRIGHGTIVGPGVVLGPGCVIGAQVTLSHCIVGQRAVIHPGVRIGQDGFGFAPTSTGPMKIPQLGRVIIGDDVEIGANTTVDRGALEDTVIGDGTKIDNLVQVGHNVEIGRKCIITAQVGISGSCRIGDGVVIGGQGGLADHVTVGAGAQIAAKTGVMRSIAPGEVVMGYPARPIRQFWREIAMVSRLTRRDK
ncbi:MAG: UDP-3-O-(3-hydroxymyristoyl)glucosamine N-acyltransferase [Rhodospirillaceae bacterium]|nr:MAG: UDP-3-O-(3-hydroxymyristoyl)glucosamine N-acyltransferase [Rhodospirillaceae bacterium]